MNDEKNELKYRAYICQQNISEPKYEKEFWFEFNEIKDYIVEIDFSKVRI